MDNQKNIIAAISLSAAVIIFYSLFFVEPVPDQRKPENKNKQNTELTSNAEAPKIDEVEEIKQNLIKLEKSVLVIAHAAMLNNEYKIIKETLFKDFEKIK